MDRVKELEQKIGYVFKDKSLIERALMHSSYTNEKHLKKYECNERLEFLRCSIGIGIKCLFI